MNDDIASQRYQNGHRAIKSAEKKYFENGGMAFFVAGHIIMQ